MNPASLAPELVQAERFLAALAPDGELTFQIFAESAALKKTGAYARTLHGSFEDHAEALSRANAAGHGIFVMVNQGDLQGRKTGNVVRVRAHFVDLDGAPIEPLLGSDLPPHIVVESSPKKWHAYWLIDDCPLDEFKQRQQALAARFDGDKLVCDLPRVMRVPGFLHQKGTPFLSRLAHPTA